MKGRSPSEVVLGVFVLAYITVSVVSYTDFPRRAEHPPLTEQERRGLALWRDNNCQACHQIYGFGGFLGPDLTNRVTDQTPLDEVAWVLDEGSKQMPGFGFDGSQQEAILAYLRAVNRTGRSQPEPLGKARVVNQLEHFTVLVERWESETGLDVPADVRAGLKVWDRYRCSICHVPFTRGLNRAADLSLRTIDRSPSALQQALLQGRGRMPSYRLSEEDLAVLSAFLTWLASERRSLVAVNDQLLEREPFTVRDIPWFEYR